MDVNILSCLLFTVRHTCHSDEVCTPCTFLTEKMCMGGHEVRPAVFLAHLWGADAIPLVLSIICRVLSVSTITTRNNEAIKSIFSANIYHVPSFYAR